MESASRLDEPNQEMLNLFHVPFSLTAGFAKRHRLAVHEVSRDKVLQTRAHLRPYNAQEGFSGDPNSPTGRPDLVFSRWQLFHAVKKTDLARPEPWLLTALASYGSWLEHWRLIADTPDFRLSTDGSKRYSDFVATSQAGRFGQGLTYLFMQSQGYPYGMRFETLLAPGTGPQNIAASFNGWQLPVVNHPGGQSIAPDFIFCSAGPPFRTALAEAKGAFVVPGTRNPALRGPLAEGLGQVGAWDGRIAPAPDKNFVTCSLLREAGDTEPEPSVLVYVDPKSDEEPDVTRYDPETVVRTNLAGWLLEMGLQTAANDFILRRKSTSKEAYNLMTVKVKTRRSHHELCLVPWGYEDAKGTAFLTAPAFCCQSQSPEWLTDSHRRLFVSGIELSVMKAISVASGAPDKAFIPPVVGPTRFTEREGGGLEGSLFADGTFFGFLDREKLIEPTSTITLQI